MRRPEKREAPSSVPQAPGRGSCHKEHKPWRRGGHIKRRLRRRKGIWYEYNRDCISEYEYVDGFWRRYWRKWFSRLSMKQDMLDANEELTNVDTTG